MNIPDEVLDEVNLLDFDKQYGFIAEWARAEALREAVRTAARWSYPGSPVHMAIRALAEGTPEGDN